jgi:thioredoxin-related protein
MKHLWLISFVISSIWGQSLNFINKDSTIIVKPGQLVNLNGARYTLINTDYDKQQIILETEIPDSAPYKYLREPIEGGFFFVSILKIPIYKYIKNTKFQMQDTLRFESVEAFKYYEKSTKSFFFSQMKGAAIGALSGFVVGSLEEGFHWGVLGGIVWGGAGMINGSIHGLLIPRESDILILSDQAWQIIK